MGRFDPTALEQLMISAQQYAQLERAAILDAWAEVSECAGGLSLFRIDGLVWQVASVIHERRNRPAAAAAGVVAALRDYGASDTSAAQVGAELMRALWKYVDQKGISESSAASAGGLPPARVSPNPALAAANAKIAELEAKLADLEKRAATPPTAPAIIANPATGKIESK